MGSDCKRPAAQKANYFFYTNKASQGVCTLPGGSFITACLPWDMPQLERIPATLHRQINSKYLQGDSLCRTDSLINS